MALDGRGRCVRLSASNAVDAYVPKYYVLLLANHSRCQFPSPPIPDLETATVRDKVAVSSPRSPHRPIGFSDASLIFVPYNRFL
jgi:hypothetical protein